MSWSQVALPGGKRPGSQAVAAAGAAAVKAQSMAASGKALEKLRSEELRSGISWEIVPKWKISHGIFPFPLGISWISIIKHWRFTLWKALKIGNFDLIWPSQVGDLNIKHVDSFASGTMGGTILGVLRYEAKKGNRWIDGWFSIKETCCFNRFNTWTHSEHQETRILGTEMHLFKHPSNSLVDKSMSHKGGLVSLVH